MKVVYDAETDTLTVVFRDVAVEESDESRPGFVLDFDAEGSLVAVEVLDASRRVESPGTVSLTARGSAPG